MTNEEKIIAENPILNGMESIRNANLAAFIGLVKGKPVLCGCMSCPKCDLNEVNCTEAMKIWLKKEAE